MFELTAVRVDGPAPLGQLEVPIRGGLNALYGRNGAGKTRLLHAMQEVLSGARDQGEVIVLPSEPDTIAERIGASYRQWLGQDDSLALEEELGPFPWRSSGRTTLHHVLGDVLIGRWAWSATWDGWGSNGDERPRAVDVVEEVLANHTLVLRSDRSGGWDLDLSIRLSEATPLLSGLRHRVVDAWSTTFADVTDFIDDDDGEDRAYEALERFGEILHRRDFFTVLGWLPRCVDDPDGCLKAIRELQAPGQLLWVTTLSTEMAKGPLCELRADGELVSFTDTPRETIRALRVWGHRAHLAVLESELAAEQEVDLPEDPEGLVERAASRLLIAEIFGEGLPMISQEETGLTTAPWVREAIAELVQSVNGLLSSMLAEAPALDCTITEPDTWIDGEACQWSATDKTGAKVGLDQLSGAQTRLVRLAFTLALDEYERRFREPRPDDPVCTPSVVLLDEPEAGLHRLAEDQLTQALEGFGRRGDVAVVAATHSSSFLRNPDVALVEVYRRADGWSTARPVEFPAQAAVDALGISRADLLQLHQLVLLVEGHHDRLVLGEVLGRELARRRVLAVPLRGTFNLNAVVDLEILAHTLEQPVLAVLDNARAEAVDRLWTELRAIGPDTTAASVDDVFEACLGPSKDRTDEEKQIAALARNLLATDQLDRFTVYGLERGDIIEYLPVDILVPDATGWEELREEHRLRRADAPAKTAKDFKVWLAATHGADFGDDALLIAAGVAAETPPEEFLGLLARIDSVVGGWTR